MALAAAPATAAGGTSIATAPLVTPGVAQSSDTATDSTVVGTDGSQVTGCWIDFEYWRLALGAGSVLTISGSEGVPASSFEVGVFPPGTSNASIGTTAALASGFPEQGRVLRFTAPAGGTYVLVAGPNCYNGMNGPYSFVATVAAPPAGSAASQRPVVTLPPLGGLPRSGVLVASVRTAAGAPIGDARLELTLEATVVAAGAGAAPIILARATPAGGAAHFRFRLPAMLHARSVRLRVVWDAAPGYSASTTAGVVVAVAPA